MSTASEASQEDGVQTEDGSENDADVVIVNGSPDTDRVSEDNHQGGSDVEITENSTVQDDSEEIQSAEASTEPDVPQTGPPTDDQQADEDLGEVESESTDTPQESHGRASEEVNTSNVEETAEETEPTDILDLTGQPETFSIKAEAGVFKEIATTIDKVVDEFRLRMTEDKLRIRAVDPANVSMVDMQIDSDAFESFTATPGVLGIPLDSLKDVINLADRNDYISMVLNPETRKLEIDVGDLDYTLGLIDPATIRQDPDLPDLNLSVEVMIRGETLDQGLTAADMVSKHVGIKTSPDLQGIAIEAEGDTDDMVQTLRERDLVDCTVPDKEVEALFALEYLSSINRALPRSDPVTLQFGDGFPARINYDSENGAIETTFMLAPRIKSD